MHTFSIPVTLSSAFKPQQSMRSLNIIWTRHTHGAWARRRNGNLDISYVLYSSTTQTRSRARDRTCQPCDMTWRTPTAVKLTRCNLPDLRFNARPICCNVRRQRRALRGRRLSNLLPPTLFYKSRQHPFFHVCFLLQSPNLQTLHQSILYLDYNVTSNKFRSSFTLAQL